MKKIKGILAICMLFILTTATTCSNDDNSSLEDNSSDKNVSEIKNIISEGSWKINYYYDTDKDETNNFTGYNFTFNQNNVLTATNGTNTITGTWSITGSSDDDNSSSNDVDFNIFFSAPENFEDLSDDWDVIEKSSTVIKLIDVSGGNGGTDYLTFTKN